ncbi:MAG: M67 family metallopeptidase [Proteobacteria bacterium]|nr:M67 family metallopeptidase [Pseudomonadota bacterium]
MPGHGPTDRVPEPADGPSWHDRAGARMDPGQGEVRLPRELMLEIYGHARECHPEECCGVVVGRPDPAGWRAVRCSNVQNARRAQGDSDLDARHAFWIDERELLEALKRAEGRGEQLRAIYHSHVDTAAYLSHEDLRGALGANGQPQWPGTAQIVVSVWEDGVRGAGWFAWDDAGERYRGRPIASD